MQLDGFESFELIGSGGNAHVYRALESATGKLVAVKVLRGAGDEAVSRRFERERSVMTELSSIANVVPVYQSGVTPTGDPYLVMPLYTGGSLQDRVDQGATPWHDALLLTKTLAEAIALAHAKRILHLDLKPANVLLDDQGRPRLADFGISEMMGNTASMSAAMMTPAFTPPERFAGKKPDELTDIYGLMATMFALLTGAAPYVTDETTSPFAVMKAVAEDPLALNALPADVPTPVRNLLLRGMAKDPSQRPRSAIELVGLLDDLLLGRDIDPPAGVTYTAEPVDASQPNDAPEADSEPSTSVIPALTQSTVPATFEEESNDRRVPVLIGLAVLVFALLGFGAFSILGASSSDDVVQDVATSAELDDVPVEVDEASSLEPSETADGDALSDQGDEVAETTEDPEVEGAVVEPGSGGAATEPIVAAVAGAVVEREDQPATRSGSVAAPSPSQAPSTTTRVDGVTTTSEDQDEDEDEERTTTTERAITSTTEAPPENSSSSTTSSTTTSTTTTSSTTAVPPTTAPATTAPATTEPPTTEPPTIAPATTEPPPPAVLLPLEAGFVWSNGSAGSEQTVSFRSSTVGEPFGFEWDFGDGNTDDSGPVVSHTYSQPGTYQVTYTVRADGTTDSITRTVQVEANSTSLEAGFVASVPDSLDQQTLFFDNITIGDANTFLWEFGDGTTSTSVEPTHTYASPGTYSVTITATAVDGSTDFATHNVVVRANVPELEAGWTASASASPNQQTLNFRSITIGDAVSFSWDFGDGNTGTGATISHTYAESGSYLVTITATTADGTSDDAIHSVVVEANE